MPLLKKLTSHRSQLLPKMDSDLTFYSVSYPGVEPLSPYSDMDVSPHSFTSEQDSDSTDAVLTRPRKRQRLDHLSQEEKVMRRKMKNRVAAQSARDRKKAKMSELEEQVAELEAERQLLMSENLELRTINSVLERENTELKLRLGKIPGEDSSQNAVVVESAPSSASLSSDGAEVDSGSVEHAEGTGLEDTYALDDAIRLLADNSESDDLLDLLQHCSEELLQCDLTCSSKADQTGKSNPEKTEMVGSPPESLEPVKELIPFDHIYYRQEVVDSSFCNSAPQSATSTKEPNLSRTETVPTITIVTAEALLSPSCFDIVADDNVLSFDQQLKCKSPLSDAGYDSANSPLCCSDDAWDETFTELFPSLV